MNVTKENIQYHLKKLLQDGIVTRATLPANMDTPRGRPTYLYRLAEQARPGNIPDLADKLLEIVLSINPPLSSTPELFERLAGSMFPFQPSTNQAQNLRQSIQRLNQHHYQASWEARASGPFVYFRTCPYASLIKAHPQLCQIDCAILSSLLNRSATQVSKIDLDSRKPPACIFQIRPAPVN